MSGEDGDIPKLAYGSIEAAAEREKKNIHPKKSLWRMSRLNYS